MTQEGDDDGVNRAIVRSAMPAEAGALLAKRWVVAKGPNLAVAAVHWQAPEGARDLPFVTQPESATSVSFRMLAHRIRDQEQLRVIAVTSPKDGEGKTSCAINLALALAEHDPADVLLIEANRRRPRLAEAMGLEVQNCLSKQMWGGLNSPEHRWDVVVSFALNLHVLAFDPNQVELGRVQPKEFTCMMDQLRLFPYRYIIVDCPAALDSADVNVIEESADAILMTARSGSTTASELRTAVANVAPARMLGIVLMDT